MTMFRIVFICVFVPLLCQSAMQRSPLAYPSPKLNAAACHRPRMSQLCDADGLMDEDDRKELDGLLDDLFTFTWRVQSDYCKRKGITGYIALAETLDPDSDDSSSVTPNDVKEFTEGVYKKYKLDDTECNKALVIVAVGPENGANQQIWIRAGRDVNISSVKFDQIIDYSLMKHESNRKWLYILTSVIYKLETAYQRAHNMEVQYKDDSFDPTKYGPLSLTAWVLLAFTTVIVLLLCWLLWTALLCCKHLRDALCPCVRRMPTLAHDYTPKRLKVKMRSKSPAEIEMADLRQKATDCNSNDKPLAVVEPEEQKLTEVSTKTETEPLQSLQEANTKGEVTARQQKEFLYKLRT